MMALLNTQLISIHKLSSFCFKCMKLRHTLTLDLGNVAYLSTSCSSLSLPKQKSSVSSGLMCQELRSRQRKSCTSLKKNVVFADRKCYVHAYLHEEFTNLPKESQISASANNGDKNLSQRGQMKNFLSARHLQHNHSVLRQRLPAFDFETLRCLSKDLRHNHHRTFSTVPLKCVSEPVSSQNLSNTKPRNFVILQFSGSVNHVLSRPEYLLPNSVRFYRGHAKHRKSSYDSEKDIEMADSKGKEQKKNVVNSEKEIEDTKQEMQEMSCVTPYQSESKEESEEADTSIVRRKSVNELTLPELSRTSYNIVPYVARSETLQNLVRLGVDLSKVEKVEGIAELLIKSKFDRDIVPYLKFLTLVGVEAKDIGSVFTRNPKIFKESVEDLELRVGYLLHKKFTLENVASMITDTPQFLLMDPVMLDEKLGFLQTTFNLTGDEVRQVALMLPKILPYRKDLIVDARFHVKEFIGFNDAEMKQIILKDPRIFISSKYLLIKAFDYLHNTMLIPHEQLLIWPQILRYRLHRIQNRHMFLLHKDRAQYDPWKENFVPLEALGLYTDKEFCEKVAKSTEQEFWNFLKTL